MMKYILLTILLLLLPEALMANIEGKIMGEDENRSTIPLPNARIMALPSKKGSFSDKNGKFSIQPEKDDSLVIISLIGYKHDTLQIANIKNNEEILIKLSTIVLDAVNVSGDKYSQSIGFFEGAKTETISTRGLQKAACCNLSESFTTNPSVDIQYSDAVTGAKRIQLLGLQSIYSQILAENIPVMRGVASIYGFSFVPGPWLESISIAKGASSVKNGFESISGLIGIDFKKPGDGNPTFLNLYADDMAMIEFNADHTVKFSDNLATTFFLHANDLFTENDHNGDNFLDKPMGQQINFMNRWSKTSEFWNNFTGINIVYDNKEGGQKGYFKDNQTDLYGLNIRTNRYNLYTKNGFILNDDGMNIGTILDFTHHRQSSFYGHRNYDAEQNSFYASVMFQTPTFAADKITVGASYQYDNYLEALSDVNYDDLVTIPGVFAEYSFSQFEDLNVLLGLRTDFPNGFDIFISPRIHAKYNINENLIIAASAGKGFRIARVIAENSGYLASSRNFIIADSLKLEEAWNYGANFTYSFKIADVPFDLNGEFYRTDFINQVVIDLDMNPQEVHFYNLAGDSYSNSYQIDLTAQPIKDFFITAAYRINDVRTTTDNLLQNKALQSREKAFLNLQYTTDMKEWAFDLTFDYSGKGRIPSTAGNPEEYQMAEMFDPFLLINAQITKSFGDLDIYLGAENITGFKQEHPIISSDNPFGQYFDASLIWGPITGRHIYLGMRYSFW